MFLSDNLNFVVGIDGHDVVALWGLDPGHCTGLAVQALLDEEVASLLQVDVAVVTHEAVRVVQLVSGLHDRANNARAAARALREVLQTGGRTRDGVSHFGHRGPDRRLQISQSVGWGHTSISGLENALQVLEGSGLFGFRDRFLIVLEHPVNVRLCVHFVTAHRRLHRGLGAMWSTEPESAHLVRQTLSIASIM